MTDDFIGYTIVDRDRIEQALDGYDKWNDEWWNKLQSYRKQRINQFDAKLWVKFTKLIGCKYEEDYKVNSFGGMLFCFEYYAVQDLVDRAEREEFHEYYTAQLKDTAKKLRSLLVVGNESPYVSAEGCNFIRRFGGFE